MWNDPDGRYLSWLVGRFPIGSRVRYSTLSDGLDGRYSRITKTGVVTGHKTLMLDGDQTDGGKRQRFSHLVVDDEGALTQRRLAPRPPAVVDGRNGGDVPRASDDVVELIGPRHWLRRSTWAVDRSEPSDWSPSSRIDG